MPGSALAMALDLARAPALVGAVRARPLPPDVLTVIRLAAGCAETTREITRETRATPNALREAAAFYIQEVLFHPSADHYRVLGASQAASREQLRTHMRWLLRWLHPDHNPDALQTVFLDRVMAAWRQLESAELRAEYDRLLNAGSPAKPRPPPGRRGHRAGGPAWVPLPYTPPRRHGHPFTAKTVLWLAAAIVLAAALYPGLSGDLLTRLGISIPDDWPAGFDVFRETAAR